MNTNGFDWVGALVNWFPMLLIVGVWIYFVMRMRRGPFGKYQQECMNMMQRQAESLERIAAALEKKI
jgi:ATP-dependent Zn protease